jgi:uncharacterized protein YcbK (DUF882 family)
LLKAVVAFRFCCALLILAVISACNSSFAAETTSTQEHHLRLYHTHTGEHIDIVYRRGDVYLPEAEEELDHFLRDHRTGDVKHYDPRVFDILSDVAAAVGHPGVEIEIICGYRTAWSNEFLRGFRGVGSRAGHIVAQQLRKQQIRVQAGESCCGWADSSCARQS